MEFLIHNLAIIIIAATLFAILGSKTRQPLILGYFLAGIIIGPTVLNLITDSKDILLLSEMGIALLLFMIGLELDLGTFKKIGISSTIIGILQVVITSAIGYGIFRLLHFSPVVSIYLGLIFSFSSTMVVAKLLREKMEIDTLHGQLVIVILLIQDIFAVGSLSFLQSLNNTSLFEITQLMTEAVIMITFGMISYYLILPPILKEANKSPELMFITAVSTMFAFSALASFFHFSVVIGAFVAGLVLSNTEYSEEISSRIKPLRDFFLIIFFVVIGMQVSFVGLKTYLIPLIAILILAWLLKPILIFLIVRLFKYSTRTSFFTGAKLGQIGEFSFVLAAQGLALNHLSPDIFSMVTVVTIISLVSTAYVIKYNNHFYRLSSILLSPFNRFTNRETKELKRIKRQMKDHIVLFGLHKVGLHAMVTLQELNKDFIVVDHKPEKIKNMIKNGINCIYGDLTNVEIYDHLSLSKANMVISTIQNLHGNIMLIKKCKELNRNLTVMVVGNTEEEAVKLYKSGADMVFVPTHISGEKISNYLVHLDRKEIRQWGRKYYHDFLKEVKELHIQKHEPYYKRKK